MKDPIAQNYRRYQSIGSILATAVFFVGTGLFSVYEQNWYLWFIFAIVGICIIIFSQRAAKMEVLTVLGIELKTYEQIAQRKESRRGRT